MKKLVVMVALCTVASVSAQGNQTFRTPNGDLRLVGCFAQEGRTRCDFTGVRQTDGPVQVSAEHFSFASADGRVRTVDAVSLMDSGWLPFGVSGMTVVGGVPYRVSVLFSHAPDRPITQLRVGEGRVQNVPISRPGAPATAPATATVQTGGMSIVLTGCTTSGQTTCCTGATITNTGR